MSNTQFLDGLALSGLLPAPLIIFSTFVGYLGGGPWGAVMMTVGIFLPAFAFTPVGHDALERVVHQPRIRLFLEGLTAGVVGLIAGTTLALIKVSLTGLEAVILFALVLAVLFASRRSEEHTSELQSLMRNSYAVFCWKKTKQNTNS